MSERKKKVRNNQYQSSRLYLRRKDHRDLVLNDVYYNAIHFIQEEEQEGQEEPVINDFVKWHKYKPKLLLGNISGYFTSIDIDNQIVHTGSNSSISPYRIMQLKDYMVASLSEASIYQDKDILISKNGHDWYQAFLSNKKTYAFVPFGDSNSFIASFVDGNTVRVYKYSVEEDEETKKLSITEDGLIASKTFDSASLNYPLSRTRNGALFASGGYSNFSFWNVTENGFASMLDITSGNARMYFRGNNRYACYGNGQAVFPYVFDSSSTMTSKIKAKVMVFANGTGTVFDVDEMTCPQDAMANQGFDVIYRNNKWWFYWYQATYTLDSSYHTVWHYRMRVYMSSDCSEWSEITLPDYIDVNVIESTFSYGSELEKIRIKFYSDATVPADGTLVVTPYFYQKNLDMSQMGMEFRDLLIDGDWGDIEQGMCFRLSNGFYAVFDNMSWTPNDNSFAFGSNQWSGYAEPIQHGDYCYS